MNRSTGLVVLLAALVPGQAGAYVVAYPAKGQSEKVQVQDDTYCKGWARSKSEDATPGSPSRREKRNDLAGATVVGAAGGAALGAAMGQIIAGAPGRGAAAGALIGGVANGTREHQSQQNASRSRSATRETVYDKAFS